MTADEYISQYYAKTAVFGIEQVIDLMEDYHQAKSKEEAEERYEIAKYCLGCDSSGIRLRTTPLIEHAIKLAAFGKEDNQ
jgi:hypothetical protein